MIDRFLAPFFSDRRIRTQYLQYLNYQHRNFDVKGLTTRGTYTLELENIFVDLSVGPQTESRASADPIQPMAQTFSKERHELWEYLSDKREKARDLVILGPPGSGKTTLLKHLTLTLATPRSLPAQARRVRKLPILLFLRDHAEVIQKDSAYSLPQAVEARIAHWDVQIPTHWLSTQLKKGDCVVMLDGLDEVADSDLRHRVAAWVDAQMARYKNNQFLVTSRPFGYRDNPLPDVTVLEVRPFTLEQVQLFVHNWYLANEIMSAQQDDTGVRMEAQKGADDLLWRLRQTHVLLEMAVNPLLLTMIATVHRYRSSLPGRRVELYAEIAEVFLGKRQEARGITYDITPPQKQRVLEELAYYMMLHRKRELPRAEAAQAIEKSLRRVVGGTAVAQPGALEGFLKMIENSSGLLVEREAGAYGFAHLTFQEYLAAVHIRDKNLEAKLSQYVQDSWWHETIRLYAAQADATNIIKACLSFPKPSVAALTLGMECLDEAREVRPELRNIFDKIAQSVDHERPEVRRLAAEVLLALRLRRLVRLDENTYVDSAFITHAEYQLFLDEESAYANYYLPDHWLERQFVMGQGRDPVVGVRPSDALGFCDWLTRRDAGQKWQYRLPHADERQQITEQSRVHGDDDSQVGYWVLGGNGYETVRFEFADSALIQLVQRHLDQRIQYDWALKTRDSNFKPLLARARELITSRAIQRRFMLFDLERPFPTIITQQPELMQDMIRARDRISTAQAYHLDYVLNDAVKRLDSFDTVQARSIDLNDVADLARTVGEGLIQADVESTADLGRQIIRNFEYALGLKGNRDAVMNPELIRALSNTRKYTRTAAVLLDKIAVGSMLATCTYFN